jgi:hypothetical protein
MPKIGKRKNTIFILNNIIFIFSNEAPSTSTSRTNPITTENPAVQVDIDDADFFEDMPADFLNSLTVIPAEMLEKQRLLLEAEERNAQNSIIETPPIYQSPPPQSYHNSLIQSALIYQQSRANSPPVYQHYTTTEDLSQLPPWQNMLANVAGFMP